jgi:DNA-binding MarR family transcriptional regulator
LYPIIVRHQTDRDSPAKTDRMTPQAPYRLPPEPPPRVREALRKRLPSRDQDAFTALFTLRSTAQQVENTVSDWLVGTAGSIARFQIMALLWASDDRGVPHKEVVAALGVTRATISGLMAGLERDGLVVSTVAENDRRNLLARLTEKGQAMMDGALKPNSLRLRAAFNLLSVDELSTLIGLLQRVRQGFANSAAK